MGALHPGLDRLRQELVAEIQASEVRTARRLDAMDAGFDTLEARIEATAAETRRHFDVAAEALRSDLSVVTEGLAALDEKTERLHGDVREEFGKLDRRFLHLEARVISTLERR